MCGPDKSDLYCTLYYLSNTQVIFANFLVISDETDFTLNAKDRQNTGQAN